MSTQRFTTPDGLRLAYDDTGMGHPVLCLPGLTRNMADFEPVVAAFSDRARILRLDSRGRGQSDWATDPMTYSLTQEAEDARGLIAHLGLNQVSILGTSRGGLIAMLIAVTHPDLIHGTILNDIGPVIEPKGLEAIMGYLGRTPPFASYEEAADRMPEAYAPAFANVPRPTWRAFAERLYVQDEDGLGLRYDRRLRDAVEAQSAQGAAPDLWPFFDALAQKPLTLIRGANSDLLSRETTAQMQARAPHMAVAEIPDRGHVPFLDEPEAVAAIAAYLDRVR